MTDQPSEAALKKACEVLELSWPNNRDAVVALARHFDAEDKAAREAFGNGLTACAGFTKDRFLPDPKPTVQSILHEAHCAGWNYNQTTLALRDAGLLREDG